jgi:outer membrane usher protein
VLQYEYASQGFAPFGEAISPATAVLRARERWLANLGGPLWGLVSGGINYVRQTRWDGDRVQSAGVSLSLPLWQRASLSLGLNKRLDGDHTWRAGMSVSLPLDGAIHTATRLDRGSDGRFTGTVSAGRNAPAGPGLGWRVEASTQKSQRARGGLQYNANQAEWALDIASDPEGQVAARAGGRGSVGLLAGMPFASRPVGQGSFAVVEVKGIAGVPIKRSHQVVAITDARGLAFVPGLLPWQQNQIEIDPVDLPLDTEVGDVVQEITPYPSSGSVVKFAVRRTRQALVVLHQPGGQPVPVGAHVRLLPGGAEFMAGRRGEVWLTDLAAERQRLQVSWPSGNCELELVLPTAADGTLGKIGPLACGRN